MPNDNENLEGVADQALLLLTQMKRNPDVMPPYNCFAGHVCDRKEKEQGNNLCEAEIEFFNEYCSSLAEFQAGIGENGVNLLLSTHPPKALYVQAKSVREYFEVRVLENYGEFETSDGNLVMLQVNSTHSLPRHDCEMLIRQGILEIAN
ncbi:partner of SLD five, PSF1 [Necator americanus]|uniref:DNA replication complex GINS protein PSF1 n=1 Tax=Necator americanus TaxID=51031 RepID=W2SHK5_NECAM|nr:partner of SLD five, PSF1 [Necator americanus]ETN69134.1 partner of SLD five, PSF1 [Necator americanus]